MGNVDELYDDLIDGLDWPMVVVTARADDDGELGGCLVGFHTQCSIHPRRHLVLISIENHTWSVVQRTSRAAVHLLGRDDVALARRFGEHTDDREDKWRGVDLSPGPGAPVLAAAPAWFEGPIAARLDAGDHTALVVEPERAERRRPFTQFGFRAASRLEPGHPP